MSSLENDILTAVKQMLDARETVDNFKGKVQSVNPLLVVMDGTSVPLPCVKAQHVTLVAENRVVVNRYGGTYVVLGVLA